MDQATVTILRTLGEAAAYVSQARILWCTPEAQRLGIREEMPLTALFPPDIQPDALGTIRQFSLPAAIGRLWAQVIPTEQAFVLIFREELPAPEMSALAQTSRILRQPLNEILINAKPLFEQLEEAENPAVLRRTAKLNRAFYQLLRTANALSDMPENAVCLPRRTELCAWLRGLTAAAGSALTSAGRVLQAELPDNPVYAEIDPQLMEQALWCLLSNAVRYSPEGSSIRLRLRSRRDRFLLTMGNAMTDPDGPMPDISHPTTPVDAAHGLGLGTMRVRHIVRQHGGVMLHERGADGEFCVTLSIPMHQPKDHLRAPIHTDRSGGYDAMLVELSDVLPDEVYDSRNL